MPDRSSARHRSFLLEVSAETFRPRPTDRDVRVVRARAAEHARCRRLWLEAGRGFWTARTRWTPARWSLHLRQPAISFCIASHRGDDVGFFELVVRRDRVKIEGLGLLPSWRGKHLGGWLVSTATERAFAAGARCVWLHTATDDHPNALPNYEARGYRIHRERPLERPMGERRAG